jgi:8-oxo-dGTP diphosphatase
VTSTDARAARIRVGVDVVVLSLAGERDTDERNADGEGPRPDVCAYLWDEGPGSLRLPGVSLQSAEDLEDAVVRALGLIGIDEPQHLEQLASFGAPDRVPGVRTLGVSYLALVPDPTPPADDGHDGRWRRIADLDLADGFVWDHGDVLTAGVQRVRSKLGYSTIAVGLLPTSFTMRELQEVYEAVLGTELDKRNFRKRVTALDLLRDTGRMRRGSHRPARLYTFADPDVTVLDDVVLRTSAV